MIWTPLHVIITVICCGIVLIPLTSFMVAGLIGTYFRFLTKYTKDVVRDENNAVNEEDS